MKDSIIYLKTDTETLIGNLNFSMPNYVEVKSIAPYFGITLKNETIGNEEWDDEQQKAISNDLLSDCFKISEIIDENSEKLKADYLKLLSTLDGFNNKKQEDFLRNRDELLKVFMRTYFPEKILPEEKHGFYELKIFSFLNQYFSLNGKQANLQIKSKVTENAEPPAFEKLETELKEYLSKSEDERLGSLAQQILSKRENRFNWFLQQEFIKINNIKKQ